MKIADVGWRRRTLLAEKPVVSGEAVDASATKGVSDEAAVKGVREGDGIWPSSVSASR
jgi:hypothetical protein